MTTTHRRGQLFKHIQPRGYGAEPSLLPSLRKIIPVTPGSNGRTEETKHRSWENVQDNCTPDCTQG